MRERLNTPFVWGVNDCCLFAADCVLAATGVDPAENLRLAYCDARGAARVLREHGGMAKLAAKHCGTEIPPAYAQFGDIGLLDNGGRPCLAVFGGEFFHAPGERGLTIHPVELCSRAWRMRG